MKGEGRLEEAGKIDGDVMDDWNKESICEINVSTKKVDKKKK